MILRELPFHRSGDWGEIGLGCEMGDVTSGLKTCEEEFGRKLMGYLGAICSTLSVWLTF